MKKKNKTLVDAQTKQWVRPPGMIIGDKSSIRSLQPLKRKHLHFFHEKSNWTGLVSEQALVSLVTARAPPTYDLIENDIVNWT
jgi:hypothetical protein